MTDSRYVDPATGSYVVEDGNYKRIPAQLGRAHNLVLIAKDSIPDAPHFRSRLRTLTTMRPGIATECEHMIDEVMQPHVGTLIAAYSRRARLDSNARLVYEMTVDGSEPQTIPIPTGG